MSLSTGLYRQIIVLVAAYSTGESLAYALRGRGYALIHVDSSLFFNREKALGYRGLDDSAYLRTFSMDVMDQDSLVTELKSYDIKAIIAASEDGVMLADYLAQSFSIPKNTFDLHHKRRHKFYMIEALRATNIACSLQFCSAEIEPILVWYRNCGLKKVVMKPNFGALSDGVAVCCSELEIEHVFHTNINRRSDLTGDVYDEYVIQEYLEGPHLVVNSVSCQGKHFYSDVWQDVCRVEDTLIIDEYADLIRRDSADFRIACDYMTQALDALDISNSPAHSEIVMTTDGPKLVESGARLAGGINFGVMEAAMGYSQLSVFVDAVAQPDRFTEFVDLHEQRMNKFVRFIYMYCEVQGRVETAPDFSIFNAVHSLYSLDCSLALKQELTPTKYAVGHPGYAMLVAETQEDLLVDYECFRLKEKYFFKSMLAQFP